MEYDLIIIGGGCGGFPAAVYASRYNLKTLVIAKEVGGLISTTHQVENFPGFISITGAELAKKMREQVEKHNIEIKNDIVTNIEKENNLYKIKTQLSEAIYSSKTILFTTGTKHKTLGIESEKKFKGRGVSYCATCDGMFFKNKTVGVIGGGDAAVKDAMVLAQNSSKVYMFVRSKIKAEPANQEKLRKLENVEIIEGVNVKEIQGNKVVESVILDNKQEIKLSGLFIAIGAIPQSELAQSLDVKTNNFGEIITDKYAKTNIEGIYAAGDVTDNHFKQAIMASAQGSIGANSAYEYIMKNN